VKPHPPDTLLGPGQQWIVVPAEGWLTLRKSHECNFLPNGSKGGQCRKEAIIVNLHEGAVIAWFEYLCAEHMGTHRWIDEGHVLQWRADPPWIYRNQTKVKYNRKKVTDA